MVNQNKVQPLVQKDNKILLYIISLNFDLEKLKIIIDPLYPQNPQTFGQKLRKWRIENNFSAKDIAKRLNVTTTTILNWERSVYEQPLSPKHLRKIKAMTGIEVRYNIKDKRKHKPSPESIGAKLRKKRIELGLTLKEIAKILKMSVSTIANLESQLHERELLTKNRKKIEEFLK